MRAAKRDTVKAELLYEEVSYSSKNPFVSGAILHGPRRESRKRPSCKGVRYARGAMEDSYLNTRVQSTAAAECIVRLQTLCFHFVS